LLLEQVLDRFDGGMADLTYAVNSVLHENQIAVAVRTGYIRGGQDMMDARMSNDRRDMCQYLCPVLFLGAICLALAIVYQKSV